jgi:glutamine synthetase
LLSFKANLSKLETAVEKAAGHHNGGDAAAQAALYRDEVFTAMGLLRQDADRMEAITDSDYWPLPSYTDMLYNI